MKIAILPRFIDLKRPDKPSNQKLSVNCDFEDIAREFGIGLCAILTPHDYEDICSICDGLIIPGSATGVNPKYYGKTPSRPYNEYDEYALDSLLLDYFVKNDKPVLGICAGHQAINIFFGGTIGYVNNVSPENHYATTHGVNIKKGSFVYDALGSERAEINSYHFMHSDKMADCLEVVAMSDDGIVEAFKHKEKNVFGVQWHPERNIPSEMKIFENFLKLCKK